MSDAWYLAWVAHWGGRTAIYLTLAACTGTPEHLWPVYMEAGIRDLRSAKHTLEAWTREQETAA